MTTGRGLPFAVAVAIAGSAAAPARALADARLSGAEIVALFSGRSIDGVYPADGTTFSETYRPDGSLGYREGSTAMSGDWCIDGRTFCTFYDIAGSGGCFAVFRLSENCFAFHGAADAAAADQRGKLAAANPSVNPSAEGWLTGRSSTCRSTPSV